MNDLIDAGVRVGQLGSPSTAAIRRGSQEHITMIHFVLHDAKDTVAVVVVEGVKAGMTLNGWIMDEDKMTRSTASRTSPSATRWR
jgi:hypothetical protein